MAQQQLHSAQVRAVVDQVRGKSVAQRVRRQRLVDTRNQRVAFHVLPEHLPRHRATGARAFGGDE